MRKRAAAYRHRPPFAWQTAAAAAAKASMRKARAHATHSSAALAIRAALLHTPPTRRHSINFSTSRRLHRHRRRPRCRWRRSCGRRRAPIIRAFSRHTPRVHIAPQLQRARAMILPACIRAAVAASIITRWPANVLHPHFARRRRRLRCRRRLAFSTRRFMPPS